MFNVSIIQQPNNITSSKSSSTCSRNNNKSSIIYFYNIIRHLIKPINILTVIPDCSRWFKSKIYLTRLKGQQGQGQSDNLQFASSK